MLNLCSGAVSVFIPVAWPPVHNTGPNHWRAFEDFVSKEFLASSVMSHKMLQ